MKKIILRSLWYVIPYMMIYLFSVSYYTLDSGDLLRLGYVPDFYQSYRQQFAKYDSLPVKFEELQALPKKKKFKVMLVGDSFSGQRNFGYKNQLAQQVDVLNVTDISWNPLEALSMLVNGDFFEHYQTEYIVLESVERSMVERVEKIDRNKTISYAKIEEIMLKIQENDKKALEIAKTEKKSQQHLFFSNQSLNFLWNSIKYISLANVKLENGVNKALLNQDLFSVNNQDLVFLDEDIVSTPKNNDPKTAEKLDQILNELSKKLKAKGIQLIYMTAPDKYDIYHDYIIDAENYPRPVFFENFRKTEKNYGYIDAQKLLKDAVDSKKKDIYLFDDSHWSPYAAEIIKDEILKKMNEISK